MSFNSIIFILLHGFCRWALFCKLFGRKSGTSSKSLIFCLCEFFRRVNNNKCQIKVRNRQYISVYSAELKKTNKPLYMKCIKNVSFWPTFVSVLYIYERERNIPTMYMYEFNFSDKKIIALASSPQPASFRSFMCVCIGLPVQNMPSLWHHQSMTSPPKSSIRKTNVAILQ